MFANSVKLFDVLGFQIRVDPSWLLIAALIVWSLATAYFPQAVPGIAPAEGLLLAIVAMLGLFAALILHELAHSLVARRFGLGVGGITLFLFGGVAELEQEPESPRSEFWIAVAGPAMSFALAAGSHLVASLGSSAGWPDTFVAVFAYIALINLVLALFNLLPAFPLDGGRVLRAALWHIRGDVLSATRTASLSGTAMGYALVVIGLLSLFNGASVVAGLWQILVGVFLIGAARATYGQMRIRHALSGRTVADLMSRAPIVVAPDTTVQHLADGVMLANAISFVPVVEDGEAIGYVDARLVNELDRENWDTTHVDDIFAGVSEEVAVAPDTPVTDLFDRIARTGRRKFMVMDAGKLVGVISLSDLTAYLAVLAEIGGLSNGGRRIGGRRLPHSRFDAGGRA